MKAGTVNGAFTWAKEYTPEKGDKLTCKSCGKELLFVVGKNINSYFKHKSSEAGTCRYAQGTEWEDDAPKKTKEEILEELPFILESMVDYTMPFGKHKGDNFLPKEYAEWLYNRMFEGTDEDDFTDPKYGVNKLKIFLTVLMDKLKI